ncbi:hypothetical protein NDU88_002655 [Pleurodeles waltl]|uniref:Uncharacterized protein n=1 Tax=Pleurodeles waltl TaxID=8319 RepID=A0AAV7Q7B6_PLEWA|nr:hypothetical protein NDU88_002655 [Pleurodeles waltl]
MLALGSKGRCHNKQKDAGKETGLERARQGEDVEGKDESRDTDKERDGDAEEQEEIRDVEKGKDGDAEAEEESRELKEQKEGSGRETTTAGDIGVGGQGTPH